jgi:hypothetical protein
MKLVKKNNIVAIISVIAALLYFLLHTTEPKNYWVLGSYSLLFLYPFGTYRIVCRGCRIVSDVRTGVFAFSATLVLFLSVVWPYYVYVHGWFRSFGLGEAINSFPWAWLLYFLIATPANAFVFRYFLRKWSSE